MNFKTIEINTFGCTFTPVLFPFDNPGSAYAYIMADLYRKAIDAISGPKAHILYCLACIEKGLAKKFSYIVQPAVEAAFAKHIRHQSARTDKTDGFLHVVCKIPGGNQNYSNDFRIAGFTTFRLFVLHRFQYIIKKYVYCNGFCNHGQSFCVCWHRKVKGLTFFIG